MLLAYFKPVDYIDLNKTLAAYQTYTQYSNYIEGTVRVWESDRIGPSSDLYHDRYVDINVKVRGDGWILAWLNENKGDLVWLNAQGRGNWFGIPTPAPNVPPTYATRLGRAIQIIMSKAGIPNFNWANIQYYDYDLGPNATRLYIFGQKRDGNYGVSGKYYVTIPSNRELQKAYYFIHHTWVVKNYNKSGSISAYYKVDGQTLFFDGSGFGDTLHVEFRVIDITDLIKTKNVTHEISQEIKVYISYGTGSYEEYYGYSTAVLAICK